MSQTYVFFSSLMQFVGSPPGARDTTFHPTFFSHRLPRPRGPPGYAATAADLATSGAPARLAPVYTRFARMKRNWIG